MNIFFFATSVLPGKYGITNNRTVFSGSAVVSGLDVYGRKYYYDIKVPDDTTIAACNVIVRELLKRKKSGIKWNYIP